MQTKIDSKLRTFVVINPVAGQSEAGTVQEMIETRLRERDIPFEVYLTDGEENIREVVEAAVDRGCRLVLAAGGDGTVSAAASALVGKNVALGIIPSGTWNALARNLDIPLDLGQALDLPFQEHDIRTIDVLEVDGRFYVLNVSVGIGSIIMRKVQREDIRRLGKFSFVVKGFLEVMGFPPHRFRVTIDNRASSFRASELIVANSGVVGMKTMRLDLDIHMDDGKLNVCRIYASNLLDYMQLGINMLTGKQRDDPRIVCWDAREEIRIESRERLPVQADGELIGHLPVTVKVCPMALHIVIPPKPAQ